MSAKSLGYFGENIAAQYLIKNGYTILARNFTVAGGEIDIIARDNNGILIFAEIKTRTSSTFGIGAESIDGRKQQRMHRAISRWLANYNIMREPDWRIDLIEIELSPRQLSLKNLYHEKDIEW